MHVGELQNRKRRSSLNVVGTINQSGSLDGLPREIVMYRLDQQTTEEQLSNYLKFYFEVQCTAIPSKYLQK